MSNEIPRAIKARLDHAHALTLKDMGRTEEAAARANAMLDLGKSEEDSKIIADALALRAVIATRANEFATAENLFDAAVIEYRKVDDLAGEAMLLTNRAYNSLRAGQSVLAEKQYQEALLLCRRCGDTHSAAYSHLNLGVLAHERKDYDGARDHFVAHLIYSRERRDIPGYSVSLFNVGEVLYLQGENDGVSLAVAAEELLTRLSHRLAPGVRTVIESWVAEKGAEMAQQVDALRRNYARRSLEYLCTTVSEPWATVRDRPLTLTAN